MLFTEYLGNNFKGFSLKHISNDLNVFLKKFYRFFFHLHRLNYEDLNLQKFFKRFRFEEKIYSISAMRQFISVVLKYELFRLYGYGLDDLGYALDVFFDEIPDMYYKYDDLYYDNFFDTFLKAKQSFHSNFSSKNIFDENVFFFLKNPFFNYGTKVVTDDVLCRN